MNVKDGSTNCWRNRVDLAWGQRLLLRYDRRLNELNDVFDSERFPDNFYKGMIVMLDRVRGRGLVRSFSGKEIAFRFPYVQVVGAPVGGKMPGIQLLNQGDAVGFDVGWTSHGLRVTTIRPTQGSS